jgi:hypothetical protein
LTFESSAVDEVIHAIKAAKEGGFSAAGWSDEGGCGVRQEPEVDVPQRLLVAVIKVNVFCGNLRVYDYGR